MWRPTFLHSVPFPCSSEGRRSTSSAYGPDGALAVQRRTRRCGPTLARLTRHPHAVASQVFAPTTPPSRRTGALSALFHPVPCVYPYHSLPTPCSIPFEEYGEERQNKVLHPSCTARQDTHKVQLDAHDCIWH